MSLLHKDAADLFKGRHFNSEIITLCVRRYITSKLSYRDVAEVRAERQIDLAHTTFMRWVQQYVPEFEKRWQRYTRPVGRSSCIGETYIKIEGTWTYLYRGVDKSGQTIDFFLSARRDIAAAQWFLRRASEKCGVPQKITLGGSAASHVAVGELQEEGSLPAALLVRTNRYLNNVIAQDHCRVKQRVRPMLGCKRFAQATITITDIELVHQIKKEQFDGSALCLPHARTPRIWEAVLTA